MPELPDAFIHLYKLDGAVLVLSDGICEQDEDGEIEVHLHPIHKACTSEKTLISTVIKRYREIVALDAKLGGVQDEIESALKVKPKTR
jgi:hypothetical protein